MTDSPPQHGDWNDLAQLVGRESARRQLLDAYAAAAPANANLNTVARIFLNGMCMPTR